MFSDFYNKIDPFFFTTYFFHLLFNWYTKIMVKKSIKSFFFFKHKENIIFQKVFWTSTGHPPSDIADTRVHVFNTWDHTLQCVFNTQDHTDYQPNAVYGSVYVDSSNIFNSNLYQCIYPSPSHPRYTVAINNRYTVLEDGNLVAGHQQYSAVDFVVFQKPKHYIDGAPDQLMALLGETTDRAKGLLGNIQLV